MQSKIKNSRKRILFDILGFSCLGGSLFLQILVYLGILFQGYFLGVESNKFIITLEFALAIVGLIHFCRLYLRFLRSDESQWGRSVTDVKGIAAKITEPFKDLIRTICTIIAGLKIFSDEKTLEALYYAYIECD